MRFRDKNGPTLYPILQTAGFAGFFRRRAHPMYTQYLRDLRDTFPPLVRFDSTKAHLLQYIVR